LYEFGVSSYDARLMFLFYQFSTAWLDDWGLGLATIDENISELAP
jgi:hypothetical protein